MVLDMMSSTAWVLSSSSSFQFFLPVLPSSSSFLLPVLLTKHFVHRSVQFRCHRRRRHQGCFGGLSGQFFRTAVRGRLGVLFQFVVPHSKGKKTPTAAGGHQVFVVKGRDHGRHLQREKKEKKKEKKKERRKREEGEKKERRKRKVGTLDMRQQGVSIPATTSHHFTPLHTADGCSVFDTHRVFRQF
jgi:hypothetical protein